jgi:hypothetical protein
VVARRYDVNANQVFAWRKRYREPVSTAAPLQLVPVTVTLDRQCEPSPASTIGLIEIELAGGCRVRVGNGVKASALRTSPAKRFVIGNTLAREQSADAIRLPDAFCDQHLNAPAPGDVAPRPLALGGMTMEQTRGSPRFQAIRTRSSVSPSIASLFGRRYRRGTATDPGLRRGFHPVALEKPVNPKLVQSRFPDHNDLPRQPLRPLGLGSDLRQQNEQCVPVAGRQRCLRHLIAAVKDPSDEPPHPAQFQRHEDRGRLLPRCRTLLIIGRRHPKHPRCLCRKEGLSVRRNAAQAHRIFWHGGYHKAFSGPKSSRRLPRVRPTL